MNIARTAAIGAVAVAFGAALLTQGDNDNDDDDGMSTPYEAACDMLNDGDTATEAYDILLELDVAPLAASRAVNEAMADGCG